MPPTSRSIELAPLAYSKQELLSYSESLMSLAETYGIKLTYDQARLCVEHVAYVNQVNAYINLTRITDMNEALVLHILDSLLFARYVEEGRTAFLDMGTGAGFPGIPLHVLTGIPGTLLDSVGKKVKAVEAFCNALGLTDLTGVHDRLESYAVEHPASCDLVVVRAVAPIPVLIEYAAPILRRGGQLLISKGNPEDDEVAQGLKAAKVCGFELRRHESCDLPDNCGHREFFSLMKVSKPSIKLPRSVGEARRRPLGA